MYRRAMGIALGVALSVLGGTAARAAADPGSANPHVGARHLYLSSGGVVCLERGSLQTVWRALGGRQTFEPVVTPELVLVGSSAGLYALERASGAVRWRAAPRSTVFSPVVAGDTAFAGGKDGTLRAVRVGTGEVLWERRFEGWVYPPALAAGRLVVGGQASRLYGLDPATGQVVWRRRLGQELVYRPVAVPGGPVVVTTFKPEVVALSASSGEVLWRRADTVPSFPPAVTGERLWLGAFDGAVRVRRLEDGALVARHPVGGVLSLPPRVASGTVLVGSRQGGVAAFDRRSGERLWHRQLPAAFAASPVLVDGRVLVFPEGKSPVVLPQIRQAQEAEEGS